MSEAPSISSGCRRCVGLGVVTVAGRDRAEAQLCPDCTASCEACGGRGERLTTDDGGYQVMQRCGGCTSARRRAALFDAAGLPPRYHDRTLGSFRPRDPAGHQQRLKEHLLAYIKGFDLRARGLLLIGDPGTGKTHLLAALVRAATLIHGLPARFIDYADLIDLIKSGFGSGRTEKDITAPLVSVPILVVDDLGKAYSTDWEHSVLDGLISRRYNVRRPLWVSTNFHLRDVLDAGRPAAQQVRAQPQRAPSTLISGRTTRERRRAQQALVKESLEERVGPRVTSRLAELCEVHLVQGPDARLVSG